MVRLALALAATAVLVALIAGCASQGFVPAQTSMPAARAGLSPEYRIFYDELNDYGDWILIEPYGFVFRPRTRFATWTPYWDGFWSPSDTYGWVWVSAEPYGWATFHYGRWVQDTYNGWVWIPGLEWAPAWVSWVGSGDYVGWSALGPNDVAASNYHFVARRDLGTSDLKERVMPRERSTSLVRSAEPISNFAEVDHVVVNRGPQIDWVEQATGPLPRARIEDIAAPARLPRESLSGPDAKPRANAGAPRTKDPIQQKGEADARKTRQLMELKSLPAPTVARIKAKLAEQPSKPAAPSDTTR